MFSSLLNFIDIFMIRQASEIETVFEDGAIQLGDPLKYLVSSGMVHFFGISFFICLVASFNVLFYPFIVVSHNI